MLCSNFYCKMGKINNCREGWTLKVSLVKVKELKLCKLYLVMLYINSYVYA